MCFHCELLMIINFTYFYVQPVILECGGMESAPTGVITSPNFKGEYPNNLDCDWLIYMPGKRIDSSFLEFDIQEIYDQVKFYKGPKSTDKMYVFLTGRFSRVPLVFSDYMYVRFVTSAQNDRAYSGFKAVYKQSKSILI